MPYLNRENPCPEPIDCRILTAALDLFVKNGFHNVSVHEIQKVADVSIGSIYNHFGGKEGIAEALYQHIVNEVDEMIDDVVNEMDSPSAQCKSIIRKLFNYTETHRNIIAYIFNAKHTEFLKDTPSICSAAPFKRMRNIVQEGMDRGEFRQTDIMVAASVIFGGAIRMIQLRLDGLIAEPLPTYLDELINTSWNGVGMQPAISLAETSSVC